MSQPPEKSYPEIFLDHIVSSFSQWGKKRFEAFLRQRSVDKWVIASDYCIRDKERPNDSFVFVVMPFGVRIDEAEKHVIRAAKRDLKDAAKIPDSLVRLLKSGKVFTFCFVIDRERNFFANVDEVRHALDISIKQMENWENADACQDLIKAAKAFRSELNKSSLNKNLVTDIVVAALLCAFIVAEIQKVIPSERIGWMSDRDKIVSYGESIAFKFWSINVNSICTNNDTPSPVLNFFDPNDVNPRSESYVRVADYVAGVAAWDPPVYASVSAKIRLLIEKVFADNRYLCFYRVAFISTASGQFDAKVSRISVTKNPHHPRIPQSRFTSLRGASKKIGSQTGRGVVPSSAQTTPKLKGSSTASSDSRRRRT